MQLLRYVYDNSDYVPSARLEDSDMRVLLSKLKKIGAYVADTKSGIHKIQANVAFTVMTHLKPSAGRHLNQRLE